MRTVEFSGVEQKVDIGKLELGAEDRLNARFGSLLLFGKPRRSSRSTTSFMSTMEDGRIVTHTFLTCIVGATAVLQEVLLIDAMCAQDGVRSSHAACQATVRWDQAGELSSLCFTSEGDILPLAEECPDRSLYVLLFRWDVGLRVQIMVECLIVGKTPVERARLPVQAT